MVISEMNIVGSNLKEWWVDTGAIHHFCSNIWIVDREDCYIGNFTTFKVEGKGTLVLKMTYGKELNLMDVLHVLEIHQNIILGLMLNKKGLGLSLSRIKLCSLKAVCMWVEVTCPVVFFK